MTDLDTFLRLTAIGAIGMLLAVLAAGRIRTNMKIALCGMSVGSIAYLVNTSPVLIVPPRLVPAVDFVSLLTTMWIWLFARQLFERETPRALIWAVLGVFTLARLAFAVIPNAGLIPFYIIHFASLLLVADLLWTAWSGRADDLIEKRRRIRLWLSLLVGLQAGGILLFETITAGAIAVPWMQAMNAALIFALALFCGVALLQTDPVLLVHTEARRPEADEAPARDALSPAEQVLHTRLEEAMAEGYYRTPGLTIAGLAAHLQVPEHRMRALINQRLGHRNFSAYLNRHRIAEAKEALADPERVDLPVLTIAMDLGYNALPTFNRAFRSETNQTPTDYRRAAFAGKNAVQN